MSTESTVPFEAVQVFGILRTWSVKGPGIVGTYGRWHSESDAWEFAVMLNEAYARGAASKELGPPVNSSNSEAGLRSVHSTREVENRPIEP